jgi:hypothetical protein
MNHLPLDYILGDNDVICGRKRKCIDHVGNKRFQKMVNDCADQYAKARTKQDKTAIINTVINRVHERSSKGGFLKYDPAYWCYYKIGDSGAVSIWLYPL